MTPTTYCTASACVPSPLPRNSSASWPTAAVSRSVQILDTWLLEDALAAQRAHKVVDAPRRDALDVGLPHHGEEGALGAPAGFEQGREVAAQRAPVPSPCILGCP